MELKIFKKPTTEKLVRNYWKCNYGVFFCLFMQIVVFVYSFYTKNLNDLFYLLGVVILFALIIFALNEEKQHIQLILEIRKGEY